MFGEANEVTAQIEKLEKVRKGLKEKEASLVAELNRFTTPGDRSCIADSKKHCIEAIRNTWAQRDKDIRGGSAAGKVNDAVINRFLDEEKAKTHTNAERLEAKKRYPVALEKYKKVRHNSSELPPVPAIKCEHSDQTLSELLGTIVNRPITNDLVEKVLTEMQANQLGLPTFDIEHRRDIINASSTCPMCFQDISQDYKGQLISAFNAAISKEAANHRQALKGISLERANIDFTLYDGKIDDDELSELKRNSEAWNSALTNVEKWIDEKIHNPYNPLFVAEQIDINRSLEAVNDTINKINNSIGDFNASVHASEQLREELNTYNHLITLLENSALFQGYWTLVGEEAQKRSEDNALKAQINDCDEKINQLNAKRKNYDVALKDINNDLASIFGNRNHIQLYLDSKGCYRVRSNNRAVALKNVSVGERNAIALAYFLSLIKAGRDQSAPYSEPLFLVIDDPVSSFDSENKMGIYSFLRRAVSNILRGNLETKIIILTHDLLVLQSLDRLCSSITLPPDGQRLSIFKASITPSRELKDMGKINTSQYAEWMSLAFKFASGEDAKEFGMTIFNVSRRIAEAYFTFNYDMGFDEAIHSPLVSEKIDCIELREFFENTAFRIGLNAGSHSEDVLRLADDGAFGYDFDLCGEEEKKQLVKNLICLLYLIDKPHVLSYLQKCQIADAEIKIRQWLNHIKKDILGIH